ncbi:MAG: peptide ABC transporter permease [Elusimicrobia bacterium GWC2_65_9]|nr:MAG: peptide ABC transporter permease [Elusimicrobia bacterium GWA2_66_18]OGR72649.1 MAG: peptide ABC transporter permease [Elusimicrobia bacterium GWC2_65_9]
MFGVTALLFLCLQFLSPEMRASLYIKDPRQLSQLDAVIEKYGLRKPMPIQYALWLKEVAHGDLGYSETAKMPVSEAIRAFFPATFELTLLSFFPIMIVGVYFGVLSAVHRDKFIDHFTRFVAITGYSLPSFVLGLLLLMVFYGKLHWLPPGRYTLETDMLVHSGVFRHWTGLLTFDCLLNAEWEAYVDVTKHMLLPAATLLYVSVALLLRITRSSMLEELSKDYVRTARAKGLPESVIIRKHALANALIPVVTLSSLLFIGLLGGVVITETVFDFPGIGRWGVQAAQQLDVPGVLGSTMLAAFLFVMANLVSDILYAAVDPRIRVGN